MYKVTVVIPIYNQELFLNRCIDSLKRQTFGFKNIEIILINDGSTDNSDDICNNLSHLYSNIKYFFQENKGVSSARNVGITNATGKYIFFLDGDDRLSKKTIKNVSQFFDTVEDEVDLVTYPIETMYNGKVLPPHFRYKYLNKTGIYDLKSEPYIGQTTMNIVVKNKYIHNILFDENQNYSEDQKYCCDILVDKLKMGYCNEAKYIYYRSENSTSGTLAGSCFIFEQCLNFFEMLFDRYDYVPQAFQGLFVNDFYWKVMCNIFFPYHYNSVDYFKAVQRVKKLFQKCEPNVVLNHPNFDVFEKFYLMHFKDENSMIAEANSNDFRLVCDGTIVSSETSLDMVLTKVAVIDKEIRIEGFLKSSYFQFSNSKPKLFVIENEKEERELELNSSSFNYYLSHESTQKFFSTKYRVPISGIKKICFVAEIDGYRFPVHYSFMPLVPFNRRAKIFTYKQNGIKICVKENRISFDKCKTSKKHIWLYYDCKGISGDNGKLQFMHDVKKQDGVKRYYVVTDDSQKELLPPKSYVKFGSIKHYWLMHKAEKVITAYIEDNNIYPIKHRRVLGIVSGLFHFEIIYLQHGVLHIKMPWKYTPEKICADKIVVSTKQETELFVKNGFLESDLLKTRMPRFQCKAYGDSQRKILYAPSWREYLVGPNYDGKWKPLKNKFISSTFFLSMNELLESKELEKLLESYDYTLEVKLHPIFKMYKDLYKIESDRIRFVDSVNSINEYSLFITDFSSYLYDFLYNDIPIISYIPDIVEFKCGMNSYRDLNYDDDFWDEVSYTYEDLIEKIHEFLDGKSINQIRDVFYDVSDPMESIYNLLFLGEK